MSSVEAKRLFVAIEIPAEIKRAISACQNELKMPEADVKWAEPQNIHLTLKFLGSVNVENIARIRHSLDKQFSGQNVFNTELSRIGAFPSLSDARILWIGLNDEKKILKNMAAKIDEVFLKLGFKNEIRAFQPHITIGRIRSAHKKTSLINKIFETDKNLKHSVFAINNLTLFESSLSSCGPTHSILHQIKFK